MYLFGHQDSGGEMEKLEKGRKRFCGYYSILFCSRVSIFSTIDLPLNMNGYLFTYLKSALSPTQKVFPERFLSGIWFYGLFGTPYSRLRPREGQDRKIVDARTTHLQPMACAIYISKWCCSKFKHNPLSLAAIILSVRYSIK